MSPRLHRTKPEKLDSREAAEELDTLLATYARAAATYSAAVWRLREIQSGGSPEDVWLAYCDADGARRRCEQVRLAVHMYLGNKTPHS